MLPRFDNFGSSLSELSQRELAIQDENIQRQMQADQLNQQFKFRQDEELRQRAMDEYNARRQAENDALVRQQYNDQLAANADSSAERKFQFRSDLALRKGELDKNKSDSDYQSKLKIAEQYANMGDDIPDSISKVLKPDDLAIFKSISTKQKAKKETEIFNFKFSAGQDYDKAKDLQSLPQAERDALFMQFDTKKRESLNSYLLEQQQAATLNKIIDSEVKKVNRESPGFAGLDDAAIREKVAIGIQNFHKPKFHFFALESNEGENFGKYAEVNAPVWAGKNKASNTADVRAQAEKRMREVKTAAARQKIKDQFKQLTGEDY